MENCRFMFFNIRKEYKSANFHFGYIEFFGSRFPFSPLYAENSFFIPVL